VNRQRIVAISEKVMEYSFYGLIFFLPISKALIESFAGFIIFSFLIKKIAGGDFSSFKVDAKVFWLLLVLFICNALSLANSGPLLGKGLKALFFKWGEYFLIFMIAIDHFKDPKLIRRFFYVLAFGAMLVGLSALSQKFFGFEFLRGRRAVEISVTGPFENPNSFSPYLVLCLPIISALALWKWPKKMFKVAMLLICFFLLASLLFAFSRAGWLGFFAGFLVMIFLSRKKKFLLSILGVFVLSLFLFFPLTQRVLCSFQAGGDSERFIAWRESLEMIQENPLLGKGLGTYMDYSKKNILNDVGSHYAHNCYLQIWAESGIFTLMAFLALAGFIFYRGVWISLKNKDDELGILLGGLTGGLLGFLVTSFFDNGLYSLQLSVLFWLMLGVTVALERVLLEKGLPYASK